MPAQIDSSIFQLSQEIVSNRLKLSHFVAHIFQTAHIGSSYCLKLTQNDRDQTPWIYCQKNAIYGSKSILDIWYNLPAGP